jgi:beta-barrel assembly-enhancing protease
MKRTLVLALLASLVGAPACSYRQRTAVETAAAKILVSDAQEAAIGAQLQRQLQTEQNMRYVNDPEVTSYVEGVAARVIDQASRDRKGVRWHVYVIDDPKQVNAFATPGGYMYVFSGLVLAADNEAELAGVLAHEAGHVASAGTQRARW